ncbi:MAG: hypothetical protein MdMp014T_2663 [Treponematales bacterium]
MTRDKTGRFLTEAAGKARAFVRERLPFLRDRRLLLLAALALLCLFAAGDALFSGRERRTMVFYTETGEARAESRLWLPQKSREAALTRYVSEVCLGPVSDGLKPLFAEETRLLSLLFRDGVVYANLSESAALPVPEAGSAFRSLSALREGVRRNFPFVRDMRLFINGREAYPGEFAPFHKKFAFFGKNREKSP